MKSAVVYGRRPPFDWKLRFPFPLEEKLRCFLGGPPWNRPRSSGSSQRRILMRGSRGSGRAAAFSNAAASRLRMSTTALWSWIRMAPTLLPLTLPRRQISASILLGSAPWRAPQVTWKRAKSSSFPRRGPRVCCLPCRPSKPRSRPRFDVRGGWMCRGSHGPVRFMRPNSSPMTSLGSRFARSSVASERRRSSGARTRSLKDSKSRASARSRISRTVGMG